MTIIEKIIRTKGKNIINYENHMKNMKILKENQVNKNRRPSWRVEMALSDRQRQDMAQQKEEYPIEEAQ